MSLLRFKASPQFVSDGCSGYFSVVWKFIFGRLPPWEGCCQSHDGLYWAGGRVNLGGVASRESLLNELDLVTRARADSIFFDCVSKHSRFWAWVSWFAVRVGGSQYLPFSWRWRYRENYFDVIRGVRS